MVLSVSDPTYPLFSTFAFVGFILSLIPLPWHLQAWNSGTCAFMIWTAISCLVGFVNSVVWRGNVQNPAPIWCDISSKIIIGVSVGIPAATLCISRRLYYLTSATTASITRDDKRRMVVIDLFISAGLPAVIMILHYVVQGHRFDILEDFGCFPVVYNTLPAYPLYFMWPPLLGLISLVFSALTLRSFWIRRLQFAQLISSNASMSVSRYLRLVLLALIDIMCTTPLGILSIYISNQGIGLAPWVSWADTHFDFSRVRTIPSIIWRTDTSFRTSVELTRWLPVACAFLFFALFGFASEARKYYQKAFWHALAIFGIRPRKLLSQKKGLATWAKPLKLSTPTSVKIEANGRSIPPGQNPPFSPASFETMAKPYESSSYTTDSTQVDSSLPAYTKQNYDVEKFAGKFRLSLPPFSPLSSDGSTLCDTPTSKAVSAKHPHSLPRRLPSYIPEDVPATSLPSPWTALTSGTRDIEDEPEFVIIQDDEDESYEADVAHFTQEYKESRHLPTHTASTSTLPHPYMSQRTILSPQRDRFYIVATDRSRTPSSPAPFSNSCSRNTSVEDVREQAESGLDSRSQTTRSPSPGRRGIQVVVHTTETRTEETV